MAIPEHSRRAEELAAEAVRYLGQGNANDTAAVLAAVPGVRHARGGRGHRNAAISRGRPQAPCRGLLRQ